MKNNMTYRKKNYQPQLQGDKFEIGASAPIKFCDFTPSGDLDDVPEDVKSCNPFTFIEKELDAVKVHDKTLSEFDE
jgi:hypothetical protein